MARVVSSAAAFENTALLHSHLYVHACGRLEAIETALEPADVCAATKRAFDLPADQELSLLHHDGREFSDASALSSAARNGETIYAQLPNTALHDVERRIDQLQHLQIGYICDQFASIRHGHTEVLQDVSVLRGALEKERVERESREDAIRRAMDEIRDNVDVQGRASRLSEQRLREELREHRASVELALKCRDEQKLSCSSMEDVKSVMTEVQEIRKAVDTERCQRQLANTEFSSALTEVRSRLDSDEQKLPGDVVSLIEASVEAERLARQKSLTELTQQLSIAVESIQEEQSLRSSEDSELTKTAEGLRCSIDELRHRQQEIELQVTRSFTDITTRLEEALRTRDIEASKSPLTASQVDSRSGYQNEHQASLTIRDLVKRLDDEVRERASDMSKLQLSISEERRTREENDNKVQTAIGGLQRLLQEERDQRGHDAENVLESLKAEKNERAASINNLLNDFAQVRPRLPEQDVPKNIEWAREIRELVEAERVARVADYKSLVGRVDESLKLAREFEVSATLVSQLMHTVSQESKERKNADDSLRQNLNEVARRSRASDQRCVDEPSIHMLREGLGKVVEALQQERLSRQEHDEQLRKDCCESVQKEVLARLERDAKLREDMNTEVIEREEAIKVVEESISKCRDEIESVSRKVAHVPLEAATERPAHIGTVVNVMHERAHLQTISPPVRDPTRVLLRTCSRSASPSGRVAKEVLQSPTTKLRPLHGDMQILQSPTTTLRPLHGDILKQGNIALTAVLPGYNGTAMGGCDERSMTRV